MKQSIVTVLEQLALNQEAPPLELTAFELPAGLESNCGSVCGCDSDTGRGCKSKPGHRTYCNSGKPGSIGEDP